ncbi:MAG: hypothetical protein ACLFSQ_03430 [Candidatus Zixiibacteriota bacterium]
MSWSYFKIFCILTIIFIAAFFACDFDDDSPISEPDESAYSAFYDTTFNVLRAYDCRIVKGITVYYDSAYIEDDEYAVIIPPDTNFYFYTPIQRDITGLSTQKSLQAFMTMLHNWEYFYKLASKSQIDVETNVGIDITGYPARGSVTFTNRLNRYSAVKVKSESGVARARRILPPERDNWQSINQVLADNFGELISDYNYDRLTYGIYPSRDFAHLFSGVSLAFLLHGLIPEYYGEYDTLLDAYEEDPELYSKLLISDVSHLCAIATAEIAGDFHDDTTVGITMQSLKDNIAILHNNLTSDFTDVTGGHDILSRALRTDVNNLYLKPAVIRQRLFKTTAEKSIEDMNLTSWASIGAISQILNEVDSLSPQVFYYEQPPYYIWRDQDTPLEYANILQPDGLQSYMVDTPVRLLGEAYDSAGQYIPHADYIWTYKKAGSATYTDSLVGRNDFTIEFSDTGQYMLKLVVPVTDTRVIEAAISFEIKDTIGMPPQDVRIIRPLDDASFTAGQVIYFHGTAWDAPDTLVEEDFEWISSRDGIIGYGWEFYDILNTGSHIITLNVTDSDGNMVSDTVNILVRSGPGNSPNVSIVSPENDAIYEIDPSAPGFSYPIHFEGIAEDIEDGIIHDSLFVWETVAGYPLPNGNNFDEVLPIGRHNILLTVVDSDGLIGRDEVNIVVSTPPVVRILAPSDGSVFADTIITFQAFAEDEEDGVLTGTSIEWRSNLITEESGYFGNGSVVFNRLPVGEQIISCRATDSHGIVRADSISITVGGSLRRNNKK